MAAASEPARSSSVSDRRLIRGALARVVTTTLAGALVVSACSRSGEASTAEPGRGVIAEVTDGDTVVLRLGGRTERARLLGIDTPETVAPGRPVECHGPEASAQLAAILPPGTDVVVTRDAEARDRYGRLLVYLVRADDSLFVNLHMVAAGHARVLTIEPNTTHASDFAAAAAAAKRAGAGLWGACPR